MKICFFCIGSGETSQAVAICKFALKKGYKCKLIATNESGSKYSKMSGIETIDYFKWPVRVARRNMGYDPLEVNKIIEETKSDVLVICNSKATSWGFLTRRPNVNRVFSVDSNWLFNQYKDVTIADWIDTCFVTFPKKVFKAGLKENGGVYSINKNILDKIKPVGFVPSGKKIDRHKKAQVFERYNFSSSDKLVFIYCGWDEDYTEKLIRQYTKVISGLKSPYKINIVYAGKRNFKLKDAICDREYLAKPSNFQLVLSASDLVVAHQGMITLFQSIGAAVPIISNVPGKGKYHSGMYHTSYYEVKILSSLDLCIGLERFQSDDVIKNTVSKVLLEDSVRSKIIKAQTGTYEPAEENVLNAIIKES